MRLLNNWDRVDLTHVLNVISKTVGHGLTPHEDTVMFVGRLGQTGAVRLLVDTFTVGDNGVGLL